MDRHHWSAHISRLDPGRDYEQIYRILVSHEFPWDMNQSLSFALYRTYAVPSIGQLLSPRPASSPGARRSATTTPR